MPLQSSEIYQAIMTVRPSRSRRRTRTPSASTLSELDPARQLRKPKGSFSPYLERSTFAWRLSTPYRMKRKLPRLIRSLKKEKTHSNQVSQLGPRPGPPSRCQTRTLKQRASYRALPARVDLQTSRGLLTRRQTTRPEPHAGLPDFPRIQQRGPH
jgi:hypothetical protein